MTTLTHNDVDQDVLQALQKPGRLYWAVLAFLALGAGVFFYVWAYQTYFGMGVSGLNHPVGWAVYIGNFVFWIGIAHSGTLISAIFYLLRAKWRAAISRSAEAMTIFAIAVAGLFPLVHLGRVWVFYYILPYPSERQIWPNFQSALVSDVLAIFTYFTVSLIFFYVGAIPDFAAARDRAHARWGVAHWRTRWYRRLALGWSGSSTQWRHYGRSYLYFAALATPLVVSVHSIVSWDFALALLPGWHATLFPPYFVAGAIHSGLAMVLTLVIPMRILLNLQRVITPHHFAMVAKVAVVTTLILAYSYVAEPFAGWFTGERIERQFITWRASGYLAWAFWSVMPMVAVVPLVFLFRWVRERMWLLFIVSLVINAGMWLERYMIVTSALSHDFLPHAWGPYYPRWVEMSITFGSFCLFLFLFMAFAKWMPVVATADVKEQIAEPRLKEIEPRPCPTRMKPAGAAPGLVAMFDNVQDMARALREVCRAGFDRIEAFTPFRAQEINEILGQPRSPVRFWTLLGALSGMAGGFALAIGTALVNGLIVGGKHPVELIPYCIPGFEGTILLGALGNLVGMIYHAKLTSQQTSRGYDARFSRDKCGLFVVCEDAQRERLEAILRAGGAEKIHAA